MPTYNNLSPRQHATLMRKHEAERQMVLLDAHFEAAQRGADVVREKLPLDRGPLRESCQAHRLDDGAEIRVDAPYAGTIEAGSPPHHVPLKALMDWVERHAGVLGISSTQGIYRCAKAIQNKIATEGTLPRWVMRGSLDELREILGETIAKRLGDAGR